MPLRGYRVEFTASNKVVHAFEVQAGDVVEALAMARADFARIKAKFGADGYQAIDPVSLIARKPSILRRRDGRA